MEGNNYFMYLSMGEGVAIVFMLGWEIFWLRRMYQVLWNMPTAKQVGEMVEMIKNDRESIKQSLQTMSEIFTYAKSMAGGLINNMVIQKPVRVKKVKHEEEEEEEVILS